MRNTLCTALLVGLTLTCGAVPSVASKRVALIIGNSRYENVSELSNPRNDAAAIAKVLREVGFDDVLLHEDLDQRQLFKALKDFTSHSAGAETAIVYYAGHGVEFDGRNYLVPTDATLEKATDVEFEAVLLDNVRTAVSGATKLRLVILDACRNNPFKLASADGKRSVGRGLARVEPGANELVAYAAKEGTVASDGTGSANSPYAAALVKHLAEPGLEVRLLFGRVRDEVMVATGRAQEPFVYGSLGGEALYLNPSRAIVVQPKTKTEATTTLSDEAGIWRSIEGTTSCGVLDSFIARYPASIYADFAKARQKEMKCGDQQVVVVTPSPPSTARPRDDVVKLVGWGLTIASATTRKGAGVAESVVITSVESGSEAEAKGLHAGDIVLMVSEETIFNPQDVLKAIEKRRQRGGKAVLFWVNSGESVQYAAFDLDRLAVATPPDASVASGCDEVAVATRKECLKSGDVFRDLDMAPEMVVLPAGKFAMGAHGLYAAEPVHEVTISTAFAMGRFEVTVDQFAMFANETGRSVEDKCWTTESNDFDLRSGRSFRSPGFEQGGSHPASCVNWHDAKAYVQWLSDRTGKSYRLPSEAEWEYAARAGTTTTYHFGADEKRLCEYANGADQTSRDALPFMNPITDCRDGHVYTAPVGSFPANQFGLYDAAGNLEEWVEDCRNDSYLGAPTDGSAWTTATIGSCINALRGGSWESYYGGLTSTVRGYDAGHQRRWTYGFRVARTLSP